VKEVIKMAEEKMACPKCDCFGQKYMLFGILALVYGVIIWLIDSMGWQPSAAWIVGGIILLLISWVKKSRKA
jgi:hypothetical protein